MKTKRLSAAVLTLAMASLSLAGTASAQTPDPAPAADPAPVSVTIPVFGTSMVITVQTDAAGEFVSADITPATAPADPAAAPVFDLSVDSNSHGGFELNFSSSADGINIEVAVADGSVNKTEVETSPNADPSAATGNGQWTGDPLGNGNLATVDYSVTLDANGDPVVDISDPVISGDPLDTWAVVDPAKSSTHEGETVVSQTVLFYSAADANGHQDSMELTVSAKVEHGHLEVEATLADPNAKKGHDDHEGDDDHGSVDDDHDSDHGSQKSDDHDDDHEEEDDD